MTHFAFQSVTNIFKIQRRLDFSQWHRPSNQFWLNTLDAESANKRVTGSRFKVSWVLTVKWLTAQCLDSSLSQGLTDFTGGLDSVSSPYFGFLGQRVKVTGAANSDSWKKILPHCPNLFGWLTCLPNLSLFHEQKLFLGLISSADVHVYNCVVLLQLQQRPKSCEVPNIK